MKRKEDLAIPRQRRRIGVHYDYDAFGQFSESIARTLGTARFLVWQSFLIIAWIIYNFVLPESWQFDPWNRGLVLDIDVPNEVEQMLDTGVADLVSRAGFVLVGHRLDLMGRCENCA